MAKRTVASVRFIRAEHVLVLIGLIMLFISASNSTSTVEKANINISKTDQNNDDVFINRADMNQTINDDSLVLLLNLDNNTRVGETPMKAVDESRYRNNGTISGARWTSAGRINSALHFDGIDDEVDCGNSSSLDITDKLTIELWMKPEAEQEICCDGVGVKGNFGVMAKAETFGNFTKDSYNTCYSDISNKWSWQLRYGSPDNCSLGFQFHDNSIREYGTWVTVKQKLIPDRWYYIVGTFDGTTIKCYLNGTLKDTKRISRIQSTDAKLLIGEEGWHNMFKGTIDEVRIYRRALTAEEIMLHYRQTQ